MKKLLKVQQLKVGMVLLAINKFENGDRYIVTIKNFMGRGKITEECIYLNRLNEAPFTITHNFFRDWFMSYNYYILTKREVRKYSDKIFLGNL